MATPTDHQKQTKEMLMNMEISTMMHMPNDIIAEILPWLPASSLTRFRWVCKYWFDLIRVSSFVNKHLLRSNSSSRLWGSDYSTFYLGNSNRFKQCYIDYTTGLISRQVTIPKPYISGTNKFRFQGSCHGLVLIECLTSTSYTSPYDTKLCILNPCTKEYKEIPPAPHYYFIFETKAYNYGFGYDRTTDDYKVIRVAYHRSNFGVNNNNINIDNVIHVYTLGTNSWRSIGNIPYTLLPHIYESGVFVNGTLYWRNHYYSKTKIISFDMGKEMFEEITKLPVCCNDNLKNWKFEIFEKSLCVMVYMKDPITKTYCVEMWVRKDKYYANNNESSWTKLFRVAPLKFLKPLIFTKSGKIVLLDREGSLFWFDPKNPTSRMAEKLCCTDDAIGDGVVYTKSLVSLNSGAYAVKEKQINIH